MPKVTIYTDGACLGNPGPGGAAAILISEGHPTKQLSQGYDWTTNNAAELMAVLIGLEALKTSCEVEIYSDSRNVIGWLNGTFKRKDETVKMLCATIDELIKKRGHKVVFVKVIAHTSVEYNEIADKLATHEARQIKKAQEALNVPALTS